MRSAESKNKKRKGVDGLPVSFDLEEGEEGGLRSEQLAIGGEGRPLMNPLDMSAIPGSTIYMQQQGGHFDPFYQAMVSEERERECVCKYGEALDLSLVRHTYTAMPSHLT